MFYIVFVNTIYSLTIIGMNSLVEKDNYSIFAVGVETRFKIINKNEKKNCFNYGCHWARWRLSK